MKTKITFILIFCATFTTSIFAQKDKFFTKNNLVLNGYDVTSYFSGTPTKGNPEITTTFDGAVFAFAKADNKALFLADPEKYLPEYGGYCAYAVANKGKKIKVDPETYEIRDGKLYLFYNSWGTNTLKLWLDEDPDKLKKKADTKWQDLTKTH